MTTENPASAKTFLQLGAIAALALVAIQAYFLVLTVVDLLSSDAGGELFRILFINSPFYISASLFLVGALGLINERNWGWILVTGAAAFRILSIIFRWIRTLEIDMFDISGFNDLLYPISFLLYIAILVMMFMPSVRRALNIENGNAALAFIVPGVLFPLQFLMQMMNNVF